MSVNSISAEIQNLQANQKATEKKLKENRENSLREAWLVNQKEMRNLPQNLSAQGANGGAVQSTMADIANEYQRSRRTAESDYANAYADSRLQYDNNLRLLNAQLADAQEAARGRSYSGGSGANALASEESEAGITSDGTNYYDENGKQIPFQLAMARLGMGRMYAQGNAMQNRASGWTPPSTYKNVSTDFINRAANAGSYRYR